LKPNPPLWPRRRRDQLPQRLKDLGELAEAGRVVTQDEVERRLARWLDE